MTGKRIFLIIPLIAIFVSFSALPVLAQGAEPAKTMVPSLMVPFFADWITSPHADRKSEAFIHWNKDGAVPKRCARCHSSPGFLDFLGADGSAAGTVEKPAPIGTVITCITCHNDKTIQLSSVTFPSGLTVKGLGQSARCMQCHQGRQSTKSVNRATKGLGHDKVAKKLRFINVHYFATGATLMGTKAKVAYEYKGKAYAGPLKHRKEFNECVECHSPHSTEVNVADCKACHKEVKGPKDLKKIRNSTVDYDGDGDVTEGIAGEVATLHAALYGAMRDYARQVVKTQIVYEAHKHPYFYVDKNGNGIADKDELTRKNAFRAFTPRLLRAAYNYQYIAKEPGAYAHNSNYAIQILYDSLADLAARVPVKNLKRMNRPK